jgi:hypothetical protein
MSSPVVAWWRILCFRAHVLPGWWLSHDFLLFWLPSQHWTELTLDSSPKLKLMLMLCYDLRSVDQSAFMLGSHRESMSRFLLLSGSCGFADVGRPLWREDGSVFYNCCWASPAQSFSGPSPAGFITIFYCLKQDGPVISSGTEGIVI